MGWLGSSLIGGVEIRERRKRYPNEPKYKRLDFVRPKKSSNTDEWDLVKVTHPRYVLVDAPYNVPLQYPQLQQLSLHHQQQLVNEYAHHQQIQQWHWQQQRQEQLALEHRQQQHQHQEHHHHNGHHELHALPYQERLAIEASNHDNDIIQILGEDDDDEVDYIEARPKVRMPKAKHIRTHSRSRSKGRRREEVYSSSEDSSDDDDYQGRHHHHHRYRSRSRGRPVYDSDGSWAKFDRRSRSRSRSKVRPLRGW